MHKLGTALDITNDGNDSNSFVGDTATATATISGGKVTGITITGVGSDYQSAPKNRCSCWFWKSNLKWFCVSCC